MVLCAFFRIFAIRNPKIKKNMAKVYVFMANGFEDVEALIPIDVLRRGGVDVITVSTTEDIIVESAHGVGIRADMMFTACDFSDADLLMLPGGMPGASNLFEHEGVCQALKLQAAAGKKIASVPHRLSFWPNWVFLMVRRPPAILVSNGCWKRPTIQVRSSPSMATSPQAKDRLLPSLMPIPSWPT